MSNLSILRSDGPIQEACFSFRPRPDQPERYDEQESFYYSKSPGVCFLIGGNGAGTTEVALAKLARFVLFEQPPPRRDTPFWIISDTFDNVCEVAWKEKLFGHGHIPPAEVDWERVSWYKQMRDWPYAVPLKPWVDRPGRNWVLEFKSYKQGRRLMQARSLGGFCFIEQFPWILLTEVLRGCREYPFRGNKICEFTPIEPGLTEDLEDLIDRGAMPEGWEIYRANTQCALEAGHVQKEWFDQFFGMVPEATRETRMTGQFPTYEGAIYSTFNPKIHCIDIANQIPAGMRHRRSLDWGSGPDNPFGALWAFVNPWGQWYVYDEYYSNDLSRSVIDHLCNVQDQWPWPSGNPFYGTTWADPSGTGFLRIASRLSEYTRGRERPYRNMDVVGANNEVLPGIEHVQYMLKLQPGAPPPLMTDRQTAANFVGKNPQVFIDRHNCKNLIRELRTYRWLRKKGELADAVDKKPEPLKRNDHLVDALRYLLFSEATFRVSDIASMHKSSPAKDHGVRMAGRPDAHGVRFHRGRR